VIRTTSLSNEILSHHWVNHAHSERDKADISFAMRKLSRFMSNPSINYFHALERVMSYLCGTMSYGIYFEGNQQFLKDIMISMDM
jgi:hypothetical protein